MDNKKIVYHVYSPEGWIVRTYSDRKQAKAFLNGINWNIPKWHYDELYKMGAEVVDKDFIPYQ